MKVRIKETGQILNVEYDDDDLYKGWDGRAVWFYANEFDIIGDEEPDDERLFTLTAEEVEDYKEAINTHIHWIHITKPKTEYWKNEMNKYEEYHKRLKQWKDDNIN